MCRAEMVRNEDSPIAGIAQRLRDEGLDTHLPDGEKLVHLWHWLVDAEINCTSTRNQIDKLRRQQEEDLKEAEHYIQWIKRSLDENVTLLEKENKQLRAKLEAQNDGSNAIFKEIDRMLKEEGLGNLCDMAITEQVASLLAERSRAREVLEREQLCRQEVSSLVSNLPDSVKLSSAHIQIMLQQQKNDYEEELRHQQDAMRHVKQQLKKVHDDEMEQLESEKKTIEEQFAKAKEKIATLVEQLSNEELSDVQKTWVNNVLSGTSEHLLEELRLERDELKLRCQDQQRQLREMGERIRVLDKLNRQLELDNETLSYKLSEVLAQYDELEDQLRKKSRSRRESLVNPKAADSSNTLDSLHCLLNNKTVSNQQEMSFVEQMKRLQREVARLQEQLQITGNDLEVLTVKYQQRKARHRERIYRLRDYMDRSQRKLREKIQSLEHGLKLEKEVLSREQERRLQVESDCRFLQDENHKILSRLIDREGELKEKMRELTVLRQHADSFDSAEANRNMDGTFSSGRRSFSPTKV